MINGPLEELGKEIYGKKKSKRLGKYEILLKEESDQKEITEETAHAQMPSKKKKQFLNILVNWLFYTSVFIFISSLGIFIYNFYFKNTGLSDLKINLIGPNEVDSLKKYSYTLEIKNNSNKILTNTNLKISVSDGIFIEDLLDQKDISLSLGTLDPKNSIERKINLTFFNEGNQQEKISLTLFYSLENRKYRFEKSSEFLVSVKNPPLKIQAFIPQKIYVNQEFQSSFQIINLSDQKLENIKFSVAPPSSFLLTSSFPQTDNLYWEIPYINPKETKNVSFIGQIQDINSSALIQTKTDFTWNNFSLSLPKENFKINLLDNPVSLSIKSNPSSKSIPIGSKLFYEITVENKSKIVLQNSQIKVYLEGPFDYSLIESSGYYNNLEKSIYWDNRNKEGLAEFKPGDQIKVSFYASLLDSYPFSENLKKNFTTKIRVEFRTPSIPPEIENISTSKEYIVYQEDEKNIMGYMYVSHFLLYNDQYFPGEGPFPLEPIFPTTLSWHIKIKTIAEDFDNITLSTKLPQGVNLTGKVAGDALTENLKFDPKTGIFVYFLNKIPANLGYEEKELDLVFQLSVNLAANVDIASFKIIPNLQYSSVGSFSQIPVNNIIEGISSYLIDKNQN